MKKVLLSLIAVLMAAGASMAQDQGTIRLNGGLVYGTKAGMDEKGEKGGIGINIGGEYFFTEKISAAPSLTYFLKSEVEDSDFGYKASAQFTAINIDGRYYFGDGDIAFYGLAGLSHVTAKVEIDSDFGDNGGSDSKTGLNIGGGLLYPINDQMSLNAQLTYNTPMEQVAIQAGISFTIK